MLMLSMYCYQLPDSPKRLTLSPLVASNFLKLSIGVRPQKFLPSPYWNFDWLSHWHVSCRQPQLL